MVTSYVQPVWYTVHAPGTLAPHTITERLHWLNHGRGVLRTFDVSGSSNCVCVGAGPITTPKGACQYALYWVLPALQPAITLFVSALGLFIIALAATAALHRLPYVAPLLLLPALWLGLLTFSLLTGALLKWVLLGRGQPTSYAKYSWAFQSKAINASITVSTSPPPYCFNVVCLFVCNSCSRVDGVHDQSPTPKSD